MKTAVRTLSALVVCLTMVALVYAEEKGKEKTVKGTICCTKCELGETDKCGNAIKVKEDGKDVIYYFDDNGGKEKYHKKICQKPAEGSVTGVVTVKDGKHYIKPSKDGVKYD
jgi:hypothetical protein